MLSFETKARLATLLRSIADFENDVENTRISVAEHPYFSPWEAF
jgi:hypothetical protein